jgi:hypothetical protein
MGAEASSERDDPLLSVEDVAREWSVSVATVAPLVADGTIASLDGGRLVRRGRMDVPCIRRSWAERMRVDSPGAARRIDDPDGKKLHPAAAVAQDFRNALIAGNSQLVHALSSAASRSAVASPEELLARWTNALGPATDPEVSMTSGVYRLDPYSGVGVRLIYETPPIPYRVEKPTPARLAGLIPLVEEDGSWRPDLGLATAGVNWSQLLAEAPSC